MKKGTSAVAESFIVCLSWFGRCESSCELGEELREVGCIEQTFMAEQLRTVWPEDDDRGQTEDAEAPCRFRSSIRVDLEEARSKPVTNPVAK